MEVEGNRLRDPAVTEYHHAIAYDGVANVRTAFGSFE